MPSATTLVLKNNAAANVNFSVYEVREDSVTWVEDGATSPLSTRRATLSRVIPADVMSGVFRVKGSLSMPVVNSTTGALDGTLNAKFEILRPGKLANADVDELVARFKELVAQSIVKDAARNGAIPT